MTELDDPLAAATHPDPYPYYAALVAQRPLARDPRSGWWVAASAAAVTAVLTCPAARVRPADEEVPRALAGSAAGALFGRLARMTDGPAHAPCKHALATVLADAVPRWQQLARMHADALLATGIAPGALALELPVRVIAAWIGFPLDGADVRTRLPGLVGDLVRGFAPQASTVEAAAAAAAAGELLDLARAAGAETVTGRLRLDGEAGERGLANAVGLLVQAHDATAGLIGNTLVALARERACDAPLSQVVCEVLRHDAPVQNTRRFVVEDTTIAGAHLRSGDVVLVLLAAANRDPAANPEPARFDPRRVRPQLFTFGVGAHACPGAALARTVAAVAVERILASGIDLASHATNVRYRPLRNARVPA